MNPNKEISEELRNKAAVWTLAPYNEETRAQVIKMLEAGNDELIESFYKNLEFGTGGLRGIMGPGTNRVNQYTIGMVTQGLANYIKMNFEHLREIRVAIAYDSRNNSKFFAETTANVFSGSGIKVFIFESLRPTPELSFAIRELGCQSGVVITASHNPKEYNGYKVYWDDGAQVISPHDLAIIEQVNNIKGIEEVDFSGRPELIEELGTEMDNRYLDKLQSLSLHPEIIHQHKDLGIVYTPIHGTGVHLVPAALKKFGFSNVYSVPEQNEPDGNFPSVHSPNPEEKAALDLAIKKAVSVGADIVMATDPDADRVGIAVRGPDDAFVLLNGNQTGAILIYYLLSQWSSLGKLKGNEFIVKTIVTSSLLSEIARYYSVRTYEVLTGFKYIADLIRRKEGKEVFIVGGEESYGYLAGDFVRDKDAVLSCALIAEAAAWARSQSMGLLEILDEIHVKFGFFREHLISMVRKGKSGAEEIASMMEKFRTSPPMSLGGSDVVMINDFLKGQSVDMISDLRYDINLPKSNVLQILTQNGSIVSIRPSGTEPKIKFYFSVREKVTGNQALEAAGKKLEERIQIMVKEIGAE